MKAMRLVKFFENNPEGLVRLISVTSPFLFLLSRWLSHGPFIPETFIFDLMVATTIILLSPWGEDRIKTLVVIALATMAGGIIAAVLCRFIPQRIWIFQYCILVTVPIMTRFCIKVYKMLCDKEFLISHASGWELAATFLNVGLAMLALCNTILAFSLIAICAHKVVLWVEASICLLLYIFLVIRSATRRPVMLGSIDDEVFRRRLHLSLAFVPPELPVRYNRMFKSMCLMLEEDKKYLNGNYTLDDMARDLCTNRGYLSKMINVCTGMHFNQLINSYRVRYSIELFKRDTNIKLSELWYLSGFGNKVSFCMAFKLYMHTTPGEWCEQYLLSIGEDPKKIKASIPNRKGKGQ